MKKALARRKRRFKLLSLVREWHDNAPLDISRLELAGAENFMLRALLSDHTDRVKRHQRSRTEILSRVEEAAARLENIPVTWQTSEVEDVIADLRAIKKGWYAS